ncbi:hypothetical protein ABDK00_009425 [Niabella insulamsoli]|uniref:hypothetical protein n=1 Tax=Niabella insulamsoli TaxID=3144874 RepID=UPI0031FE1464
MIKILGVDKEVLCNNVWFTGDAIALLNNYAVTGSTIDLKEWDWYRELRSGMACYFVTGFKKVSNNDESAVF